MREREREGGRESEREGEREREGGREWEREREGGREGEGGWEREREREREREESTCCLQESKLKTKSTKVTTTTTAASLTVTAAATTKTVTATAATTETAAAQCSWSKVEAHLGCGSPYLAGIYFGGLRNQRLHRRSSCQGRVASELTYQNSEKNGKDFFFNLDNTK